MGSRIGRAEQIRIYVGKCWRLFVNEKQWKNLVSTLIIMGMIALVTSENTFLDYRQTKNTSFSIVCACIWVGLFNSIQSICRERGIIKREHRSGLYISSYVLAHVIFEAMLCAAEALIILLVVLVKNASHMPESGLVFPMAVDMYITIFLTVLASDMMAILVSCIVKDPNSAMTVMPFVLIIQLVMSGVIFDLEGISDKISNLTISKWGMNALMSISFTTDAVYDDAWILTNGNIPAWQSADDENLAKIWLILILISIASVVCSMIALRFVDKDKR
ncbi:MAG: ABC transporter permease [Eubacteriales bacterium]|nr:ABC transporter permease [Eubacteriales bacterium]